VADALVDEDLDALRRDVGLRRDDEHAIDASGCGARVHDVAQHCRDEVCALGVREEVGEAALGAVATLDGDDREHRRSIRRV
jgi:hypothetical protein